MRIRSPHAARAASAAALAVAAVGGLASCSSGTATGGPQASGPAASSGTAASSGAQGSSGASAGATGTWTETGDYATPGGPESVRVVLTAKQGTVTAVQVTGSGRTPNAQQYQAAFASGISAAVVGKPLASLEVGAVSGSSLTGKGFDAAVEKIRADAA